MSLSQALNQFAQNLGRYPDNTTYTQLDEWYEVNVPLLDEDNDYTQFYVKPGKNSVTFSDDCATSRMG